MPPKFGTSGLRGLVTELTPALVTDYVRAFLAACPQGRAVHVGRDLRPSSEGIAAVVIDVVRDAGFEAVDAGAVPTPALAMASPPAGDAAVLVTGRHIPADRNGLKFYVPSGEISKTDEIAIHAALGCEWTAAQTRGSLRAAPETNPDYIRRYTGAFGSEPLFGLRIGIYQHSSVARDILVETVEAMGAQAVPLARSDIFIPVDTEAVDPETRPRFAQWCAAHKLDAVMSTDADADRPMLTDATGRLVPGDVLGPLTARFLGARTICTPVSSNSLVDAMPDFDGVQRCRIGSPFVIAAMEETLARDAGAAVVGYEANGGFLLGFAAEGPAGPLPPLMTRDCLLPMLAPLADARARGQSLAELVAALPARFTAADRVAGVETEAAQTLLAGLRDDPAARAAFFDGMGPETRLDLTDGLRVHFAGGAVVHLRPSGNAPECRCYAEAGNAAEAERLVATHLQKLAAKLRR